jgi:hypothetical protein
MQEIAVAQVPEVVPESATRLAAMAVRDATTGLRRAAASSTPGAAEAAFGVFSEIELVCSRISICCPSACADLFEARSCLSICCPDALRVAFQPVWQDALSVLAPERLALKAVQVYPIFSRTPPLSA